MLAVLVTQTQNKPTKKNTKEHSILTTIYENSGIVTLFHPFPFLRLFWVPNPCALLRASRLLQEIQHDPALGAMSRLGVVVPTKRFSMIVYIPCNSVHPTTYIPLLSHVIFLRMFPLGFEWIRIATLS